MRPTTAHPIMTMAMANWTRGEIDSPTSASSTIRATMTKGANAALQADDVRLEAVGVLVLSAVSAR